MCLMSVGFYRDEHHFKQTFAMMCFATVGRFHRFFEHGEGQEVNGNTVVLWECACGVVFHDIKNMGEGSPFFGACDNGLKT